MNKKITYFGILLFLIAILVSPSFSQSIPEPRAVCEGSQLPDGTYIPKGEVREVYINGVRYRCVGCGGCTLNNNSFGRTSNYASSPGLTPFQQMQLQMFQGIMAPLFGALG